MSQHFEKYQRMRDMGASAEQIYLTAKGDGLDKITCIRLLRQLCDFSLTEAKEAMTIAEKRADSLEQYQERFLADVENLRLENDKYDTLVIIPISVGGADAVNELEIIIREDTDEGSLFYQQDPEVEQYLIYLRSPNFTAATYRVELEDPVLFRLNANRILSAVKIVIPRHVWQITQSIPVPAVTLTASLEFPVTTIQQQAFNLEANIITNADYTHVLVTFGQPETETFWVALSSQCWALIAENRLKGFFMLLERCQSDKRD